MIKKLKSKVFLIIMLSVSLILIGIIVIFAYLNYNNTINAATSMMDRFNDFPKEPNNKDDTHINDDQMSMNLDNTYSFMIDNGKIIDHFGEADNTIEEYAQKVYRQNKENGIIEDYVYKTRDMKDGRTTIILMKNEDVVNQIKYIYVFAIIGSVVAIIITYIVSKKLSNIIVKPVEETIEKQKQFISDASHELKTPLAVIEANAEVLENEIGTSKWMTYIQSEISSMDKLINDLLFLAKVENINELNKKEMFNISEEINMICSMFESMAYEKQINMKYNIKENIEINANKEDIKQVTSILLENAIMHTKSEGNVFVELDKEKNNVIVQVKNEGDPIPEKEKNKIFERFYRVDKSRNRKQKRYGLGLAIAKSIIDKYNGKIYVNCKDGITTFKVNLPTSKN